MVRRCEGLAGRWITDPFSFPVGTPVTKVGLDHASEELGSADCAILSNVHDRHCLTILSEAVRDLLKKLSGYPCEGNIVELELKLDCVKNLSSGVRM